MPPKFFIVFAALIAAFSLLITLLLAKINILTVYIFIILNKFNF